MGGEEALGKREVTYRYRATICPARVLDSSFVQMPLLSYRRRREWTVRWASERFHRATGKRSDAFDGVLGGSGLGLPGSEGGVPSSLGPGLLRGRAR